MVGADDLRPVLDAAVFVAAGPSPAPDIAALTNERGWFVLDGLTEGEWVLRARGPGGETGTTTVTVYANAATDATITLARSGLE